MIMIIHFDNDNEDEVSNAKVTVSYVTKVTVSQKSFYSTYCSGQCSTVLYCSVLETILFSHIFADESLET